MNIVSIPKLVLFTKAKPIGVITSKIRHLVSGMEIALAHAHDPKGVGLAAPQVDKSLRLFIVKLKEKDPYQIFINPQIIELSNEIEEESKLLEGCLSIPGIWGPVKRHKSVRLSFQTIDGKTREETFTGLMATTIQHELDHLDGVLFTARVMEQKGKLYRLEKDENGEDAFNEIKI